MDGIERAGMYPAIPLREAVESRGKAGRDYVYHYFGQNPTGRGYLGPGGKRRVYIGAPDATQRRAEANRLWHNREKWETLDRQHTALVSWLSQKHDNVGQLARAATGWALLHVDIKQLSLNIWPQVPLDDGQEGE